MIQPVLRLIWLTVYRYSGLKGPKVVQVMESMYGPNYQTWLQHCGFTAGRLPTPLAILPDLTEEENSDLIAQYFDMILFRLMMP